MRIGKHPLLAMLTDELLAAERCCERLQEIAFRAPDSPRSQTSLALLGEFSETLRKAAEERDKGNYDGGIDLLDRARRRLAYGIERSGKK